MLHMMHKIISRVKKFSAVLFWCWNINQLPVYRITLVNAHTASCIRN